MKLVLDKDDLLQLALEQGFTVAGILSSEQANQVLAENCPRLSSWQEKGHAAEMQYMQRPPELFSRVENYLPEVKSVVCLSASYLYSDKDEFKDTPAGYGRVARYAWGKDYHRQLKKRAKAFTERLEKHLARKISSRIFSDSVPLLERAMASAALEGFIGKNTMFILPGVGSYTFLSEILLDVEIRGDFAGGNELSCKTCRRCLDVCPTAAFESAYSLDSRKCISYLTIEKKTEFNSWEQAAIADWLFGCDICQEVCPFNHKDILKSEIAEFDRSQGAGPYLKLSELLSIRTNSDFLKRFAGTPIMRAGREQMLRNAACVLANTKCFSELAFLIQCSKEDSSEFVRTHAGQSLQRMYESSAGQDRRLIATALC